MDDAGADEMHFIAAWPITADYHPLISQWDENFDIGSDTGTPVDDQDYQVLCTFTGKLNKLTPTIERPQLTPADVRKLQAAARNNHSSE